MKGKKLIWLLPLSAAMLLAGCNPGTDEPASSDVTPTTSETPTPSSSETPTPSSSEASTSEEDVTHREGFNHSLAEGAVTRSYDERFDKIVEDFSGETPSGTTTGTLHNGVLREVVDSNLTSFQNSSDAAIFKMASSTFEGDKTILGQSSVGFKMRVIEGKLPIKDLILGIRGGDGIPVYPVSLSNAIDPDGEKLPELTNEFQDILIDVGASVNDENAVYEGTTTNVLTNAIGFHLYVKGDAKVSAVVEIEEVYFVKGADKTSIDKFDRDTLSKSPNVYWGPTDCADALFVKKGVKLGKDQNYTTKEFDEEEKSYSHIVLNAMGDLSGASVSVTYDDEASTVKTLPFASLKAQGDKAVVNAIDGAYSDLAIDLTAFEGPEGAKVKKVSLTNAKDAELQIGRVFLTNFQVPDLNKRYPSINTETAVTFDNFNRNFSSLSDNWDASSADEKNVAAGINGFVSYKNGDKISTSDGHLNLPGTVGDDYDEVTIGSTHVLNNAQYLVFSIKGEEGYDLNNFRIEMNGKAALYFNSALAMEGVKTYGDETYTSPYVTADGFTWYIIDLAQNDRTASDLLAIYYTGEKAIQIDSIFYANGWSVADVRDGSANTAELSLNAKDGTYAGNAGPSTYAKYFAFSVKGDGEKATLHSFRVQHNGGDYQWIKDGKIDVYDSTGKKVNGDTVIPAEGETYYVDITSDAFSKTGDGWSHLFLGMQDEEGSVTLEKIFMASDGYAFASKAAFEATGNNDNYGYCGGWDVTAHADRLMFTVSADKTCDLANFRVEKAGSAPIFASNVPGMLKNLDGTNFDLTSKIGGPNTGTDNDGNPVDETVTVILDLKVAGIDLQKGDVIHFHNDIASGKTMKFGAATAYSDDYPVAAALANYNQVWAVTPATPAE